jgi:hypothetical protein
MFIGSFFFLSAKGQPYFTVRDVKDTMQFKNGVARTAWLLSSVNNGNSEPVRILVYGQSISEQSWWKDVREFVTNRFPSARINFINQAIGGFSSERLKLMVENDVVSFILTSSFFMIMEMRQIMKRSFKPCEAEQQQRLRYKQII